VTAEKGKGAEISYSNARSLFLRFRIMTPGNALSCLTMIQKRKNIVDENSPGHFKTGELKMDKQ
jgi:hypothetical protein